MAGEISTQQPDLRRVTYHAVARFVERILGIKVTFTLGELPTAPAARQRYIAAKHCAAANKSIDEIRAQIMVPAVAVACLSGFSQVQTTHFLAVIDPKNGVVITIAWRNGVRKRPRCKGLVSKAEARRELNRKERAKRSTPSGGRS